MIVCFLQCIGVFGTNFCTTDWALDVNVPYGGSRWQQTRVGDVCCVELGVTSE